MSGNLTFNGEIDRYTATLTGGTPYSFTLVSPNIQDLSATFTDSSDKVETVAAPTINNEGGNLEVYSFTPPSSGNYNIFVSSASLVSHGNYQLLGALAPAILFTDTTTHTSSLQPDTPYIGPVTYLQTEFIYLNTDNVNIIATAPNEFLKSGSGEDAIKVLGGQNVLDGGTNSNFLVGGSGNDTFFTDGRGPGTTWDTIESFHHGDNATLWGFVKGVSVMSIIDSAGTPGFQGVTIDAHLGGGNGDALITFAGVTRPQFDAQYHITTGSVGGNPYLNVTT